MAIYHGALREVARRIWWSGLVVGAIVLLTIGYRIEAQRLRYSRAKADLSDLRTELEHFRLDYGHYPTTEGLGALYPDGPDPGIERGMSAPHAPRDPWGNPYFYQSDGEDYALGSFGPHGSGDNPDPNLPIQSN
jgi:general secretion pathway protein G